MEEIDERKGSNIISEIITHMNQIESKLASLEEMVSEANDLQIVNKLDIINMKNELEKIRLVLPSLSEEQAESPQTTMDSSKIMEMGERLDSVERELSQGQLKTDRGPRAGRMEVLLKENSLAIQELRSRVQMIESSKAKTRPSGLEKPDIDEMRAELKALKERISGLRPVKIPDMSGIQSLKEEVDNLASLKERMDSVSSALAAYRKRIEKISGEISLLKKPRPDGEDISGLRDEISSLRAEMEKSRERIKKDTLRFVLKELGRVVNG